MQTAHALPASKRGTTHITLDEVVIAVSRRTILVRARLGTIEMISPVVVLDAEAGTTEAGPAVPTFVADPDIVERVVVLEGERYDAVFARAVARGLPQGDFGRQDLLAECDAKGW